MLFSSLLLEKRPGAAVISDHLSIPDHDEDDIAGTQDTPSHIAGGSTGGHDSGLAPGQDSAELSSRGTRCDHPLSRSASITRGGYSRSASITGGGSVGPDGGGSSGTGGGGDSVVVTAAATTMGGGRGATEGKRMEVEQEFLGRWIDLLSGHGDLVRCFIIPTTNSRLGLNSA